MDNNRVSKAMALPYKQRKYEVGLIRKEAMARNNIERINKGENPIRQRQKHIKSEASDVQCNKCKGVYGSKTIWKHKKYCASGGKSGESTRIKPGILQPPSTDEFSDMILKAHNLIFVPNKIRLNLINTFVMSRNKHISKKTRCFSRKRSKNKAKPNEFERRILKLSCYACSDNPICRHAFSMFRNVSRMNSDLRCITETSSATLQ